MSTTRITWHDVLLMPEDGKRYEAIDGELYVTAAPNVRHQVIHKKLVQALIPVLEEPGHGVVLYAPLGVEFPETGEGVQPDIFFVSADRLDIVAEDWVRGAPDLVIEILSPTTAERDRTIKRKLYARHGVAEYWVVDPESESVEVWEGASGAREPKRFVERLPVRLRGRAFGEIELAGIFPPKG